MLAFLRRRRRALDAWLAQRSLAHTVSLPPYLLHREVRELLSVHAADPCLDAGAGRSPLRDELRARGIRTITIDIEARADDVDHIADVQHMPIIDSDSMGTVLSTQVLEHVARPWDAAREISRVLRPGGFAIVSVPHLSLIHEAPHDYYRYTRYGVRALLEHAGMEVMEVRDVGGLFAFLLHPVSILWLSTVGAVPGLLRISWWVNYVLFVRLAAPIDRRFGMRSLYPCNQVAIARRPGVPPTVEPGGESRDMAARPDWPARESRLDGRS